MDRGHYVVDQAPFALRIDPQTPAYRYTRQDGKFVEVSLKAETRAVCEHKSNVLYLWENLFPSTDYVLQAITGGVSALLVLRNEAAPKEFKWNILGDRGLLQPSMGRDAKGRLLELEESFENGVLTVKWTGRVIDAKLFRVNQSKALSKLPAYPVTIDPTVNEAVIADADDKRDFRVFTGSVTSAIQDITNIGAGRYNMGGSQFISTAGIRFQTVAIPQGATVTSAQLQLRTVSVFGPVDLVLYCNDVDDAAAINTTPGNIRNRTPTTAVSNITGTPANGTVVSLPATGPVQEVISRTGFASGNDIMLILRPADNTFPVASGVDSLIGFAAFNHATLQEPRLVIEYTEAAEAAGQPAAQLMGL